MEADPCGAQSREDEKACLGRLWKLKCVRERGEPELEFTFVCEALFAPCPCATKQEGLKLVGPGDRVELGQR